MSTELTGLAVSVVLMSLPPTPSSLSVASNASGSHYVNVPTRPFVRSVSHGRAFQIQQELLAREAAGVPGQTSAASDDAVAGHDDADRVPRVGGAHGPDGGPVADRVGELGIGASLPVGDGDQQIPDAPLELRAGGRDGEREPGALPGEVLTQLFDDGIEPGPRARPDRLHAGSPHVTLHVQPAEDAVGVHQRQHPQRRLHHEMFLHPSFPPQGKRRRADKREVRDRRHIMDRDMVSVRAETDVDLAGVRAVHRAAFHRDAQGRVGYAGRRVEFKQRLLAMERVKTVPARNDFKVNREAMYTIVTGDREYCVPTCGSRLSQSMSTLTLFGTREGRRDRRLRALHHLPARSASAPGLALALPRRRPPPFHAVQDGGDISAGSARTVTIMRGHLTNGGAGRL